ncbi:S-layer protein [Gynuella sp.]|uniref:S-layer protein n=1 Tax=Gynuella sp. TaxID=2969146 RepID=UPI003D14065C
MTNRIVVVPLLMAITALSSCGTEDKHQVTSDNSSDNGSARQGYWVTGDLHVHTALSQDARSPLADVLSHGFDDFGLDYISISNHMRNNSQDNDDNDVGGLLYYDALTTYELPGVAALQADKYQDKLIYSTFEWDMPTHEHYNVGILWDDNNKAERLAAIKEFEYRFSYKNNDSDFSEADLQAWKDKGIVRQNATHEDALAALAWLEEKFPDSSYGMLNHPRRYANSYTIKDIRELNDAAPDVFFLAEGMVGNQFNGERGDYGSSSADGVHGGVDPVVSELGGWWDALLGEGRKIWNTANSDHHFKTRIPYASGYYPGEYAKNYTWIEGQKRDHLDSKTLLSALRSGNTFSVFGDLINALDFSLQDHNGTSTTMGGNLSVAQGEVVTVTVRFKVPETNNREQVVNDENYNSANPGVHHIDLIVGDVGKKAVHGTAAYDNDHNDSTHVAKSFTASDWYQDNEGFYVMTYTFTAEKDQYLRLRGSNLDYNVEGLTVNGEPQRSEKVVMTMDDYLKYYEDVNNRNYADLWFYSNPIFISVHN